tara:strand:+ start:727 stop:924 length:198 start_codon:yes stop_codon:yes gene_type:complete
MYIVGELKGEGWEFCGIFSTEEKALERCLIDDNFIARVELDKHEPIETIPFEYAYYPLLEDKPNA